MKKIFCPFLVLVLILSLTACGVDRGTAEGTLKGYFEATASGDTDLLYDILNNPHDISYDFESDLPIYPDEAARKTALVAMYKDAHANAVSFHGKGIKLTEFQVVSTLEYTPEQVADVSAYLTLNNNYPEGALEALSVITCNATISGEDRSSTDSNAHVLAKIGGKWYLYPAGISTQTMIESILSK